MNLLTTDVVAAQGVFIWEAMLYSPGGLENGSPPLRSRGKAPVVLAPSPPLDNIRVMVIVWRLRGNIIRTALCWSV